MLETGRHGQLESRILLTAGGLLPPAVDADLSASAAVSSGSEAGVDASDTMTAADIQDSNAAPSANVAPAVNTFGAAGFVSSGTGRLDGLTTVSAAEGTAERFPKDERQNLPPAVTPGDKTTAADQAAFWADSAQIDLLLSDQTIPQVAVSATAPQDQSDSSPRGTTNSAALQSPRSADEQHVSHDRPMASTIERHVIVQNGTANPRVGRVVRNAFHRPLRPIISWANPRSLLPLLEDAALSSPQTEADGQATRQPDASNLESHVPRRLRKNSRRAAKLIGWLPATRVPLAWKLRDVRWPDELSAGLSDEGPNAGDWADSPQNRQRDDTTIPRRHLWAGRGTHPTEISEQPLLSDVPPEPPETDSEINWFHTLCHPRGPPDNELHSSPNQRRCGHSFVLLQLRHRIAPRGPSLAHFTDCERAIQIPHEAECSH